MADTYIDQEMIAIKAAVSRTTVCNVLQGKGRYSEETVHRVYRCADELGYQKGPRMTPRERYRRALKQIAAPIQENGAGDTVHHYASNLERLQQVAREALSWENK